MAGQGGHKGLFHIADSLHIKRHTAGTSNEISLSVLDSRRSELDDAGSPGTPQNIHLGGLGKGVSVYTTPEPSGRKRRRKKSKSSPTTTSPGMTPSSVTGADLAGYALGLPTVRPASGKDSPSDAATLPPRESGSSAASTATSTAGRTARLPKADVIERTPRADRTARLPKVPRKPKPVDTEVQREKEVRRRKRHRRIRRVLLVMLLVGMLATGAAFGYQYYVDQKQVSESNAELLRNSMDELQAADEVVLALDQAVMSEAASDEAAQAAQDVLAGLDGAAVHLNAAKEYAHDAIAALGAEDPGREAASQVIKAVEARETMIEKGRIILEEDAVANRAMSAMLTCWETVLEGERLVKESAALVEDTSQDNTKASEDISNQALEVFALAREQVQDVRDIYPSEALDVLDAYIDKRVEEIGYAIASDQAIYALDKATADAQNELYNQADAEAVDLMSQLPERPEDIVLAMYEDNVSDAREEYFSARSAAGTADSFLRDYLQGEGSTI